MTMRFRLDRIQQRPDSEHWNDDDLLSLGEPAALYWAWHVDITDAALSAEMWFLHADICRRRRPHGGTVDAPFAIAGLGVGGIGRDHGGQQYEFRSAESAAARRNLKVKL
jgi:hypothetical protein